MKNKLLIVLAVLALLHIFPALSRAAKLTTPTVEVPALLSHTYSPPYCEFNEFRPGWVRDGWELSANGPSFTDNLTDYNEIELLLSAGAGKKFSVVLPEGASEAWLHVNMLYRVPGQGDISLWADSDSVTLENLKGGPVVEDYLYAYAGQNGNVIKAQCILRIQGSVVSFTGVKFNAVYTDGIPVPDESKTYTLEAGGTDIFFSYQTFALSDPNAFVTIIDESAPVCTAKPAMDFNDDCKVDFADFAIFCMSWLDCGLDPPSACWE